MNKAIFLIVPVLLAFNPVQSSAQELNSWGDVFSCAVDWFGVCKEKRPDEPNKSPAAGRNASSPRTTSAAMNLPLPVRNVLENPSPETARAYVLWSKQANEKLAKASEYIAQATREINSEASIVPSSNERSTDIALTGVGPVGLYYFFSPDDQSAVADTQVLNKIWGEGQLGVIGIPVRGKNDEVMSYLNEAKPLFPIRRSDAEVKLVKPAETPDLYLALPLEKKILRLGSTITETAIAEAIGRILAAQPRREPIKDALESNR